MGFCVGYSCCWLLVLSFDVKFINLLNDLLVFLHNATLF